MTPETGVEMHNKLRDEDTREDILVSLISIKQRLSFLSKLQVINGEQFDSEELSQTFASFKNELETIIDTYQKVI